MNKVVVTGMGVVTSIGNNVEEFDVNLRNSVSGIHEYEMDFDCMPKKIPIACPQQVKNEDIIAYYKEKNDDIKKYIKKCLHRVSVPIRNAVKAAVEALSMAKLLGNEEELKEAGIIISGTNICMNEQYNTIKKVQGNISFVSPTHAMQFMDSDHVGVLSEILNIHGEGMVIGAASASGNAALIQAIRMVAYGELEKCVVVGAMSQLSPIEIIAFENCGALAVIDGDNANEVCRPFDEKHKGFVYGEGNGCLVIESELAAKRRKADILAEITGWGTHLDGTHSTAPSVEGELMCMKKALEKADISIEDIDYVNAHGSSSAMGDKVELTAINELMKNKKNRVYVNSSKSYFGHCINSAAIIEVIAAICQIRGEYIHANINLKESMIGNYTLPDECIQGKKVTNVLKNSFGFGGINTSIVIKRMC